MGPLFRHQGLDREGTAVDQVRDRIEKELGDVMDRLRQLGGGVVIEVYPGALDDDNLLFADLMGKGQVQQEREMCFATRSLLVERANRLAEALQRLGEGEYGTCEECGEAIAPARLKAMPEVTTCVHCQDHLERSARQLAKVEVAALNAARKRNRRQLQRTSDLFS
jgi:DnaK suppressor protein